MVSWPSFSSSVIAATRSSIRLIRTSSPAYPPAVLTGKVAAPSVPENRRAVSGRLPAAPFQEKREMNDQSGDLAKAASDIEEAAHAGLVPQLTMMVRALLASRVRNTLFLLAGSIFLVVLATAYGQIRLNSWN